MFSCKTIVNVIMAGGIGSLLLLGCGKDEKTTNPVVSPLTSKMTVDSVVKYQSTPTLRHFPVNVTLYDDAGQKVADGVTVTFTKQQGDSLSPSTATVVNGAVQVEYYPKNLEPYIYVDTIQATCTYNSAKSPIQLKAAVKVYPAGHIAITSPATGTIYQVGDTLKFHWMSLDSTVGGGCQIEISFDDGMSFYTIDDGTGHNPSDANWGDFDWKISDSLQTINERQRPITLSTISNTVIIHIADFYNKIGETMTYASGRFAIQAVAAKQDVIN